MPRSTPPSTAPRPKRKDVPTQAPRPKRKDVPTQGVVGNRKKTNAVALGDKTNAKKKQKKNNRNAHSVFSGMKITPVTAPVQTPLSALADMAAAAGSRSPVAFLNHDASLDDDDSIQSDSSARSMLRYVFFCPVPYSRCIVVFHI